MYGEIKKSILMIPIIRPEDVAEMIIEMKQDGIDVLNNEDLENDRKRAMHWATIGIGKPGYYKKDK